MSRELHRQQIVEEVYEAAAREVLSEIVEGSTPEHEQRRLVTTIVHTHIKAGDLGIAEAIGELWHRHLEEQHELPDKDMCATLANYWSGADDAALADKWRHRLLEDAPPDGAIAQDADDSDDAHGIESPAVGGTEESSRRPPERLQPQYIRPSERVIYGYLQVGNATGAESWLRRLIDAGRRPGKTAFKAVLQACAASGRASEAEGWIQEMVKAGIELDTGTFTSLISAYAVRRRVAPAEQAMRRMQDLAIEPTVVTYGAIIGACARAGDPDRGEEWLRRMSEARLAPNEVVYRSLIAACAEAKRPGKAERWFNKLVHSGFDPGPWGYTSVVAAWAGAGELERARQWFRNMQEAGVDATEETFGALIDGHAKQGDVRGALAVLAELEGSRLQPNILHFNQAIDACGRARPRAPLEAESLLRRAVSAGLEPSPVTMRSLGRVLGPSRTQTLLGKELKKNTKALRERFPVQVPAKLQEASAKAALRRPPTQRAKDRRRPRGGARRKDPPVASSKSAHASHDDPADQKGRREVQLSEDLIRDLFKSMTTSGKAEQWPKDEEEEEKEAEGDEDTGGQGLHSSGAAREPDSVQQPQKRRRAGSRAGEASQRPGRLAA